MNYGVSYSRPKRHTPENNQVFVLPGTLLNLDSSLDLGYLRIPSCLGSRDLMLEPALKDSRDSRKYARYAA